jgi:hypothetical protein
MFPYCFLNVFYSIYKKEKDIDFVQLYILKFRGFNDSHKNFKIYISFKLTYFNINLFCISMSHLDCWFMQWMFFSGDN